MRLWTAIRRYFHGEPIATAADLALFMDRQAAFVAQKSLMEHSQARASTMGSELLRDQQFLRAFEIARWRAYPLVFINIAEMVEGVLRNRATEPLTIQEGLSHLGRMVLERYPVPEGEPPDFWHVAAGRLAEELALAQLHPPKRVSDIPERRARELYHVMPVSVQDRRADAAMATNNQRLHLCSVHEIFLERAELDELARDVAQLASNQRATAAEQIRAKL
jgi:hypothetical protein